MRSAVFYFYAILLLLPACKKAGSVNSIIAREPNAAVADTSSTAGLPRENLWKNRGCDLITDDEVQKMFAFDGKETYLNVRTLPDQAFCLRKWNKPDWKERENNNEKDGANWLDPQNNLIIQVFGYVNNIHAGKHLDQLKRDRRETWEQDVHDLGDGGVWSTSTLTLLVRKGHLILSITLNLEDEPKQNLPHAMALANIALAKM